MKYDIEIVIPVSFKAPYGKRIQDFKKYGLLNIKDKKVLLTLLIGTETNKIEENWPDNVDVNIVSSDSDHEVSKVYLYFSNYKDQQARWIAKFDDDSINDISNLVNKLDEDFDHAGDYYIITEFRPEQHRQEDDILKSLGYGRWFNPSCTIWHELEGSVLSHSALTKITNNESAVNFMKKRAKIEEGYTDYALACAARISKIYPIDAYFLSRHPLIGDLAIFGGHLTHIHDISHDKNEYCLDLLIRMMNKNVGSGSEIYPEIVNKEFVYRNWKGLQEIKLREDGIIERAGDAKIWHIKSNGLLEFLRSDGTLIDAFDNYENTNFMKGYSTDIHAKEAKPSLRKLA